PRPQAARHPVSARPPTRRRPRRARRTTKQPPPAPHRGERTQTLFPPHPRWPVTCGAGPCGESEPISWLYHPRLTRVNERGSPGNPEQRRPGQPARAARAALAGGAQTTLGNTRQPPQAPALVTECDSAPATCAARIDRRIWLGRAAGPAAL